MKEAQEDSRRTVKRLQDKVAATKSHYEDMMEHMLRFARRQRPPDFNREGHEEQYFFNLGIQDNISVASRQSDRLETSDLWWRRLRKRARRTCSSVV